MKKLHTVMAVVLTVATVKGEIVLHEPFDYSDGAVISQPGGIWKNHSGTSSQMEVIDGRLSLTQFGSEDIHATLEGAPFKNDSGGMLYASFEVEFSELPSGNGSYFAHFKDDSFGYRGRIFAQTTGATPGYFRLGVASTGKSATAVAKQDLDLDTVYRVVIAISLTDARTTLWIEPENGNGTGISTPDNGSGVDVTGFAYRQAKYIGSTMIDNLKIGTSFLDVAGGNIPNELTILSQPASQTALVGKNVTFSVVATGADPLQYQWQKEGVDIDGGTGESLSITKATATDAGAYAVLVSNAEDSIKSDPATLEVLDAPTGEATTIAHLHTLLDDNFEPSDTKTIFTAEGIVTTHANMTGGSNSLFYFQDETAGIAVYFRGGKSSHPKAGDRVLVTAPLDHYNGLLQLVPSAGNNLHLVKILSSENPLPEPANFDFEVQDDTRAMETLEGSLVVVSDVEIDKTGGTNFPGGANLTLTDNQWQTFTIRIDSRMTSIIGEPIPGTAIDIVGVLSQYMRDIPRVGGYQLMPTRIEDIQGPKLPNIQFTVRYENLIRPGRPVESTDTAHFLLPGETLTIEATASDARGREVDVIPFGNLPTGTSWKLSDNPAKSVTATLVYTAGEADSGETFRIVLEASNKEGTHTVFWNLYVPTKAEQQVAIAEFLANPTADDASKLYNPLDRETPSSLDTIRVEDEFIEIANLSEKEIDLDGWSIADAVAVRSRFYEGDMLPKRGALVVYGGRVSGDEPRLLEGVVALPATESASGLGLNNNGDVITLRDAEDNVIDRVAFGSTTGNIGSATRHPGLNATFVDHGIVAVALSSAGTWPGGDRYTTDPVLPIPEIRILASLVDEKVTLRWDANPAHNYTLLAADSVTGPFKPVSENLQVEVGQVTFSELFTGVTRFYRVIAEE